MLIGCGNGSSGGGVTGADSGGTVPPLEDAGLPVNGCDEAQFAANDHTADSDPRVVEAPPGSTPQQYVPSCIRIKAGQTVTFVGDNADHPIDTAEVSGLSPGPFPIVSGSSGDAGSMFTVTIAEPGITKFNCDIHPTLMKGAIQTVP